MVCEGRRRPVNGGARSLNVGRCVARINGSSQKSGQSSSGCCLESQSRAQSLKARDALLPLFIRRVAVARARRREGSVCRVGSQECWNSEGAEEIVDFSWSQYLPERRCRAGGGNVDVMRRAVCTATTKRSGCRKLSRQARKSDRTPRKTREDRAGREV